MRVRHPIMHAHDSGHVRLSLVIFAAGAAARTVAAAAAGKKKIRPKIQTQHSSTEKSKTNWSGQHFCTKTGNASTFLCIVITALLSARWHSCWNLRKWGNERKRVKNYFFSQKIHHAQTSRQTNRAWGGEEINKDCPRGASGNYLLQNKVMYLTES